MTVPPQITFRHIEPSAAVEQRIRDEVDALEKYFDRITSCRVVVEAPAPHHHHGQTFQVRIFIAVPGSEIVVDHRPSLHSAATQSKTGETEKRLEPEAEHKDIYVCIADAFSAARRQLEDYVRVMRGEVKGRANVSAAGPDELA